MNSKVEEHYPPLSLPFLPDPLANQLTSQTAWGLTSAGNTVNNLQACYTSLSLPFPSLHESISHCLLTHLLPPFLPPSHPSLTHCFPPSLSSTLPCSLPSSFSLSFPSLSLTASLLLALPPSLLPHSLPSFLLPSHPSLTHCVPPSHPPSLTTSIPLSLHPLYHSLPSPQDSNRHMAVLPTGELPFTHLPSLVPKNSSLAQAAPYQMPRASKLPVPKNPSSRHFRDRISPHLPALNQPPPPPATLRQQTSFTKLPPIKEKSPRIGGNSYTKSVCCQL